jgi:serine protease Do
MTAFRTLLILLLTASNAACASKFVSLPPLSEIVEKVDPSVVVIHTAENEQKLLSGAIYSGTSRGLGTGVLISADGKILTASHVVQTADQLVVKLVDGRQFRARVVSTAPFADLATIQLIDPPTDLSYVEPGNSDDVKMGDGVFVIGTPYGVEHTLSVGYLSGRRTVAAPLYNTEIELLQTDAAVNQGNSGGPMFTRQGALVGIVSHIKSKSGGSEGLGFATSINIAKSLLLTRPAFWSGLEIIPVTKKFAKALNIPGSDGLLVQKVAQGSFADRIGLRAGTIPATVDGHDIKLGGDVIIAFDEQAVRLNKYNLENLMRKVDQLKQHQNVTLVVLREGRQLKLKLPETSE